MTISELCKFLRNWFEVAQYADTYTITNGVIEGSSYSLPLILQDGQYYRIAGSVFNDGVHKYGDETDILTDENAFYGTITAMAIPKDVLTIVDDINEWEESYGQAASSPFVSESFGGYSYTKGSTNSNSGSSDASWQSIFAKRLSMWRKI